MPKKPPHLPETIPISYAEGETCYPVDGSGNTGKTPTPEEALDAFTAPIRKIMSAIGGFLFPWLKDEEDEKDDEPDPTPVASEDDIEPEPPSPDPDVSPPTDYDVTIPEDEHPSVINGDNDNGDTVTPTIEAHDVEPVAYLVRIFRHTAGEVTQRTATKDQIGLKTESVMRFYCINKLSHDIHVVYARLYTVKKDGELSEFGLSPSNPGPYSFTIPAGKRGLWPKGLPLDDRFTKVKDLEGDTPKNIIDGIIEIRKALMENAHTLKWTGAVRYQMVVLNQPGIVYHKETKIIPGRSYTASLPRCQFPVTKKDGSRVNVTVNAINEVAETESIE